VRGCCCDGGARRMGCSYRLPAVAALDRIHRKNGAWPKLRIIQKTLFLLKDTLAASEQTVRHTYVPIQPQKQFRVPLEIGSARASCAHVLTRDSACCFAMRLLRLLGLQEQLLPAPGIPRGVELVESSVVVGPSCSGVPQVKVVEGRCGDYLISGLLLVAIALPSATSWWWLRQSGKAALRSEVGLFWDSASTL